MLNSPEEIFSAVLAVAVIFYTGILWNEFTSQPNKKADQLSKVDQH